MSGSSLDGLDLAQVAFRLDPDPAASPGWSFRHTRAEALADTWRRRLGELDRAPAREVAATHAAYGRYLGQVIASWHRELGSRPDLVAVHGHTLFHEPGPDPGFSTQIGDGAWIAAQCGCPVVCDFRNADIAAGGQGAPMAPLADSLLFPEYDGWLNLGGIANLTLRLPDSGFLAWDVCGCNQLLNALAGEAGLDMDRDGLLAARGTLIPGLLQTARELPWHALPPPRSLSNQRVREELIPLFRDWPAPPEDRLHTAALFVASLVADAAATLPAGPSRRMMVSGGGLFHPVLADALTKALAAQAWTLVRPAGEQVVFKEALLIALAGALRREGRPNFVARATGARQAVCGGALYLPPPIR